MFKSSTGGRLRKIAESKNSSAPETFNEDGQHPNKGAPIAMRNGLPVHGLVGGGEYEDTAEGMSKAGAPVPGPSPFGKLR